MSKILKVTIEFDDKTIWIEGEEAEKWQKGTNSQGVMSAIHGMPFPEIDWKTIDKEQSESEI